MTPKAAEVHLTDMVAGWHGSVLSRAKTFTEISHIREKNRCQKSTEEVVEINFGKPLYANLLLKTSVKGCPLFYLLKTNWTESVLRRPINSLAGFVFSRIFIRNTNVLIKVSVVFLFRLHLSN